MPDLLSNHDFRSRHRAHVTVEGLHPTRDLPHTGVAAWPLLSRMQANVREASMPELSATEQSEQSNIVTWKVISVGTAIVLVVFLFLWL
jgi:hypothetical protein